MIIKPYHKYYLAEVPKETQKMYIAIPDDAAYSCTNGYLCNEVACNITTLQAFTVKDLGHASELELLVYGIPNEA